MKKLIIVTLLLTSTLAYATPPLPVVSKTIPASAIDPTFTEADAHKVGYSAGLKADGTKARNVLPQTAKAVYAAAGIVKGSNPDNCHGGPSGAPYEVDHRISVMFGGTNDISNLTLQEYCGAFNAHDKDKLELYVRDNIRNGKLSLNQGRQMLYLDWKTSFINVFGKK